MLKLIAICDHCKKSVEIKSEIVGNYVETDDISNQGLQTEFDYEVDASLVGNLEDYEDASEVDIDTEVTELQIRFTCHNCGANDYLIIKNS